MNAASFTDLGFVVSLFAGVVLTGVASSGCAPTVADGAQRVYAVSRICPTDAVSVHARPDLKPRSVLKSVAPAAGTDLDAIAETFELSGCNAKALYVCARPVVGAHADPFSVAVTQDGFGTDLTFNTDLFTLTRAIDVSGGRVTTAVVCQPADTTVQ